jgi:integrase
MAVRKRGSRWVADYYDAFKVRRWKTFDTRSAAKDFEASERAERGEGALAPVVAPDITLADYARKWLTDCEARGVKPKTIIRSESALRLHILPRLGSLRVRDVSRPAVRNLLLGKLAEEGGSLQGPRLDGSNAKRTLRRLSRGTVRHLLMTISGILSSAVEDGLLKANPVRAQAQWKRLGKVGAEAPEESLAFETDEATRFLEAARKYEPAYFPALATMMLTGLRVGEALAVTADRIDLARRTLRVDRQIGGTPKDNEARTVDLAAGVVPILQAAILRRTQKAPRVVNLSGDPIGPEAPAGPWLFHDLGEQPTPKDEQRVYKSLARAFARVLALAGLPAHHTLKSLRHTFASQPAGSPAYVQAMLGHSSIELTVGTYGRWLRKTAPGAVDGLASDVLGSSLVANGPPSSAEGA